MSYSPLARILIRYVVGLFIGADAAGILAADPDMVTVVAAAIGFATEAVYTLARKRGWAT